MCPSGDRSHVEAWKALFDFTKTLVSLSAAILTALIGYYVVEKPAVTQSAVRYVPPVLIVVSIVFAIYGIGRAIRAIKSGKSESYGVLLINISVWLLILGILTLPFAGADEQPTLDCILLAIQSKTTTKPGLFLYNPTNVVNVKVRGTNYIVRYKYGDATKTVTYSTKVSRILAID